MRNSGEQLVVLFCPFDCDCSWNTRQFGPILWGCDGAVQMATVEKRWQADTSHPATIVFALLITPYKYIPSLVTEFPSVYWLLLLCCFVVVFFTDSFGATEIFLSQQIMQSDGTLSIKAERNTWGIVQSALKNKSFF